MTDAFTIFAAADRAAVVQAKRRLLKSSEERPLDVTSKRKSPTSIAADPARGCVVEPHHELATVHSS